jgi:PAS domain S-box-containing protein
MVDDLPTPRDFSAARAQQLIEDQFGGLFLGAPCGVLVLDRSGRILGLNASVERLFGWRRADLLGQLVEVLLPESLRAGHVHHRSTFEATEYYDIGAGRRLPALHRDGREITVTVGLGTVRCEALADERLVVAFVLDPSEVDNAERRYQTLFEQGHDAVFVLDDSGVVQECNCNALRLGGRTSEQVLGHRFLELLEDPHVDTTPEELERRILGGEVRAAMLWLRRPSGERVVAEADASSISFGKERLVFVVMRDVTEQLRTQAHLQMSDRMVTVGTLAAGVAHEINNPLAAVIANLELALRDLEDVSVGKRTLRELADGLEDAKEAADRVRQIVRDLKVFSRSDEDKRGPVDVERVLDSSLRMAWNSIRHAAKVVKTYGYVRPVLGNESRIGQVFLNLLINAAQAIGEGHAEENEIRVATTMSESERMVVIEITDTGPGMAPEVCRRLFSPFFTTKPVGVGTGLGLSISHRIVSELGGEITVDTALGRGTCFRITLPAASFDALADASPGASLPPLVRRGRVLVVDDEPIIAKVVRRTLTGEHDVVGVTSAREALELLGRGTHFDVILTDLMMPEMTGMELYAELGRLDVEHTRRVVFLTGGAFTPSARAFLDGVPNPSLDKPFDAQQLRLVIASLVR